MAQAERLMTPPPDVAANATDVAAGPQHAAAAGSDTPTVLHVLDHSIPLHSGYSFRTRNILREQRAMGWRTVHVTGAKHSRAARGCPPVETVDGLEFYRTAPGAVLSHLPVVAQWDVVRGLEQRLDEIVRRERPQLIHAHSPALNGLAALRVARRHGLPLVYECRAFWEDAAADHGTAREGGPRYLATRALETRVFRGADAVVTICEGLRADITARGIAAEKVTVVPNAVDLEALGTPLPRDDGLAAELGLGTGPVIGFIGSFYAYEGLDLLIDAMPEVLATHPGAMLLLVGGGPREGRLRERAVAAGLADHVRMPGRVAHADVARYYSVMDLLVFPRLGMRLTELVTPLKPLEAMAQCRPVVASDVGGHRELVRDGDTGLLFRAGRPEALAAAIRQLLADPVLRRRLVVNGRRFVEHERTWPASAARYVDVYRRAGLTLPEPAAHGRD